MKFFVRTALPLCLFACTGGTVGGDEVNPEGGQGGTLETSMGSTGGSTISSTGGTVGEPSGGAGGTGGTGGSSTGGAGMTGGTTQMATGGSGGVATGGTPGPVGDAIVPMFVAIGKVSRTTVSCDDGRTWIANKSSNDSARCWQGGGPECDHHEGSGTALAYGNGVFIANFGWGSPGKRWRSEDGVTWNPIPNITETLGGMAFVNGRFVGGAGRPPVSTDGGKTWTYASEANFGSHIRKMGSSPYNGGKIVMMGDAPLMASATGSGFVRPAGLPSACVTNAIGTVSGNDVTIAYGGKGDICSTTDGGTTWTHRKLSFGISAAAFAGGSFLAYSDDRVHRSANGVDWTTAATQPPGLRLEQVAASDKGTLVGVHQSWGNYYDKQVFYRSTDGVRWTALPKTNYAASHPITYIAFGHGKPSAACPAP